MSIHGVLTGGIKRSSGVNVLPEIKEVWEQVRDDVNTSINWLIAGYREGSKTDIIILCKGGGGINECSASLPQGKPVFGGCRLKSNRFVTFFYADEQVPSMQKGRAAMHKNGVLNVLVGSDCEVDMYEGLTEETVKLAVASDPGVSKPHSGATRAVSRIKPIKHESILPAEKIVKPKDIQHPPERKVTNHVKPQSDKLENRNDETFFPYSTLKDIVDISELPSGVDPAKREQYLSHEEFLDVFGMEKIVFNMLPGWKQKNLKKAKGLF